MILFKEAFDKNKLNNIKENQFYSGDLKRIHEVYEQIKDKPIETLTKSEYFIYKETGNRMIFEKKYFERRTRLDIYFIMYLLYEREEDLKLLEDVIWAVCGEFSWALPAHVHWEDALDDMVYIDLFAAETGQTLGEILYILNDKLSAYIKDIMKYEIKRRITDSFENRTYYWEDVSNNWAAVCAGCVGMTYIYCAPEKYHLAEIRIMHAMESFLSGYGSDGMCTEGLAYWNYGFGYYIYFAELLYEFSEGKKDLLNNDKIKEIAKFQQRMYLSGNVIASFSDGGRYSRFERGLSHRLKDLFPEDVVIPGNSYVHKDFYDMLNRFAVCIRSILWSNPEYSESEQTLCEENYYPDAQWYINKRKNFGFAAKSGHNAESHNHNDIGNFIIASQSKQMIADIGAGEYVKEYFMDSKRYNLLCCSSLGHNVPVIDDCAQKAGMEFKGDVIQYGKGIFALDIASAYGYDALLKAERKFTISENSVLLNDSFEFADDNEHDIKERFISLIEPEVKNGCINIENMKLSCSQKYEIKKDSFINHNAQPENVWIIEFCASEKEFNIEFIITED